MPRMLPDPLPQLVIRPPLPLQYPSLIINVPDPRDHLIIQIPPLALGHALDETPRARIGRHGEHARKTLGAPAGVPGESRGIEDPRRDKARVGVDVGLSIAALARGEGEILELNVGECEAMLCGACDAVVGRGGERHVVPFDSLGVGVRVFPVEDGHDECARGEAGGKFADDEHARVVVKGHFQVECRPGTGGLTAVHGEDSRCEDEEVEDVRRLLQDVGAVVAAETLDVRYFAAVDGRKVYCGGTLGILCRFGLNGIDDALGGRGVAARDGDDACWAERERQAMGDGCADAGCSAYDEGVCFGGEEGGDGGHGDERREKGGRMT